MICFIRLTDFRHDAEISGELIGGFEIIDIANGRQEHSGGARTDALDGGQLFIADMRFCSPFNLPIHFLDDCCQRGQLALRLAFGPRFGQHVFRQKYRQRARIAPVSLVHRLADGTELLWVHHHNPAHARQHLITKPDRITGGFHSDFIIRIKALTKPIQICARQLQRLKTLRAV